MKFLGKTYYYLAWKRQEIIYRYYFFKNGIRTAISAILLEFRNNFVAPREVLSVIIISLWLKFITMIHNAFLYAKKMEKEMEQLVESASTPVEARDAAKERQKSIRKTRSDIMGMFSQYQDVTVESVVTLFRQAGFNDEQISSAVKQLTLVLDENRNKYVSHVNRTLEKNFL
jgi:hypothetical protein